MVLHSKENDNSTESDTGLQTSTKDVSVFGPPGEVSLSDDMHEEVTGDKGRSVVTQVVWSVNQETTDNQDRLEELDVLVVSPVDLDKSTWESEQETNQETPLQNWIKTVENLLWTNDTPQNRGREESGRLWTREFLGLVWCTVTFNGAEGQVQSTQLNKS